MTLIGANNAFEVVAAYLNVNGWYQDGNDPGLWLPDGVSIGYALVLQLDRDHFHPWIDRRT